VRLVRRLAHRRRPCKAISRNIARFAAQNQLASASTWAQAQEVALRAVALLKLFH
jgi:hypothetical protein